MKTRKKKKKNEKHTNIDYLVSNFFLFLNYYYFIKLSRGKIYVYFLNYTEKPVGLDDLLLK